MATLKITVDGRPHAGKTTVALIIEKALKEAGFEVAFKDELEGAMQDGRTIVTSSPDALDRARENLQKRTLGLLTRREPCTIHIVGSQRPRTKT